MIWSSQNVEVGMVASPCPCEDRGEAEEDTLVTGSARLGVVAGSPACPGPSQSREVRWSMLRKCVPHFLRCTCFRIDLLPLGPRDCSCLLSILAFSSLIYPGLCIKHALRIMPDTPGSSSRHVSGSGAAFGAIAGDASTPRTVNGSGARTKDRLMLNYVTCHLW